MRRNLGKFLDRFLQGAHERFAALLGNPSRIGIQTDDLGVQALVVAFILKFLNHRTAGSLNQNADVVARQTENLLDGADGADGEQIVRPRQVGADITLRRQENLLTSLHGSFQRLHRDQPADIKMNQCLRKRDQSAQGQDRKSLRCIVNCLGHGYTSLERQMAAHSNILCPCLL